MNGRIREYCVIKYNNYHAIRDISAPSVISESRASTKMPTQSCTRNFYREAYLFKKSPKLAIRKVDKERVTCHFSSSPHPMKYERKYINTILFCSSNLLLPALYPHKKKKSRSERSLNTNRATELWDSCNEKPLQCCSLSSIGFIARQEGCNERRNERLEEMAVLRKEIQTEMRKGRGSWKYRKGERRREEEGRREDNLQLF